MNIKLFFEIIGEFFDLMYTGGHYECDENYYEKKDIENVIEKYNDNII